MSVTDNNTHKVFISYHHDNDQEYKEELLQNNAGHNIFIDKSVDTGDIDPGMPDESIRTKIRDEYLRDSSVTLLLVGTETAGRKHVDWELYSSMIDGHVNKKSGVIIIQLPTTNPKYFTTAHGNDEKKLLYPELKNSDWLTIDSRSEYERRYPFMPARMIDQLLVKDAKVSVTQWSRLGDNFENLAQLIEYAYKDRSNCNYDLSRPMKKIDS